MPKHTSRATKADGEKASARRRNINLKPFVLIHPKAWVNKLCTNEDSVVLKEV